MKKLESKYQAYLSSVLQKTAPSHEVDLVVGIPFLSGDKRISEILPILQSGLDTFYPELQSIIVCVVGSSFTDEELENLPQTLDNRILVTALDKDIATRGWAIRSLMDTAHKLTADLLIFESNLLPTEKADAAEGLTPDWIKLMYQPIRDNDSQFVLPRFKMSHVANSIGSQFVFPLLASLYNVELRGCLDSGMALSRQLLPKLLNEMSLNGNELIEYGLNYWVVAKVLEMKTPIAEVYLGVKPRTSLPVGINYLFGQVAHVLFNFIEKSQDHWKSTPQAVQTALNVGHREDLFSKDLIVDIRPHIVQFRRGYNRYYEAVWSRIFSEDIKHQLEQIISTAAAGGTRFSFPASLWAQIIYQTIIAYHFIPAIQKEDLVSGLAALFEGRLAGYFQEIKDNTHCSLDFETTEFAACPLNARTNLESQVDSFVSRKSFFKEQWLHHTEELQPFLPEISYWEYIPGIPIILPHAVKSADGKTAHVYSFYESLLREYTEEFISFVKEHLDLTPDDGPEKIAAGIRELMQQLEEDLDQILIPGDLTQLKGIEHMANKIFDLFPHPQSMSLKAEVAEHLIKENPPRNLITIWGYHDTQELLENHHALDILAIAPWSEADQYSAWNTRWLRKNLSPADFEMSPILPVVVDYTEFPALTGMREASTLDHLSSRVVISNLREGSGGDFPKTRFLTTTLKRIIEASEYGKIWETYMQRCMPEDFAEQVMNSIGGHWGVSMFSAHSIFEHIQHTMLRDKLIQIAAENWDISGESVEKAKKHMKKMAEAYHLGLTLPDGTFMTCCIWSWASYSFKGGKGIPTPLSLMVERRWFSGELFFRLYEQVQNDRSEIYDSIIDLMGQGKENEDLSVLYLGSEPVAPELIVEQQVEKDSPDAGVLTRSPYNPILAPVSDHDWENKYVLNCGTIRINGSIYILYRAVGDDGISRLGLAVSKNGLQIDERLPDPAFSPEHKSEEMGCEDPRLVAIDGRIYMLYTAYDGVTPQIALASIPEEDFVHYRWDQWFRHGLVFPGFHNKDAVLFPERFDGKLAMYHRIAPSIWLTYAEDFNTPWPKEGHKIILGTRSGMTWDAVKIGAGAQPIKTKFGWLHIYHGVDYAFKYSLGVFITPLHDPSKLIYRSPNPILEPEASYEVGVSGKSWVPNVVFTCGAVPTKDKDILDEEDELLVYYGGADTVIGVASAKIKDIVPQRYRKLP